MNLETMQYIFGLAMGNFAVIDYRDIAREDLSAVLEDLNELQQQGFEIVSATSEFIWLARSTPKAQSHDTDPI